MNPEFNTANSDSETEWVNDILTSLPIPSEQGNDDNSTANYSVSGDRYLFYAGLQTSEDYCWQRELVSNEHPAPVGLPAGAPLEEGLRASPIRKVERSGESDVMPRNELQVTIS